MPANNCWHPPRCLGTRCLISSKAHNVSESRPPANCIHTNNTSQYDYNIQLPITCPARSWRMITWWALYAKCTPWSRRASWLDSLSEFRTDSNSIVTLFMYTWASFIEARFICINCSNSSLHTNYIAAWEFNNKTIHFFFKYEIQLAKLFTVWINIKNAKDVLI